MDIFWVVLVFLEVFAPLGRVNDLEACTPLADLLCFPSELRLALLGIRALFIFLFSIARAPSSLIQRATAPLALLRWLRQRRIPKSTIRPPLLPPPSPGAPSHAAAAAI